MSERNTKNASFNLFGDGVNGPAPENVWKKSERFMDKSSRSSGSGWWIFFLIVALFALELL